MAGSPSTTCWTPSLRWEKGETPPSFSATTAVLVFLKIAQRRRRGRGSRGRSRGSSWVSSVSPAVEAGGRGGREIGIGGVSVKS